MKEVVQTIVVAAAFVGIFGVFASCTYNAQKDYNACVQAAASADVAELCERVK